MRRGYVSELSYKYTVWVLVGSLHFSSCAANRIFTSFQLEQDEKRYEKIMNKNIEVFTQTDKRFEGYLESVKEDSIIIMSKQNGQLRTALSKQEIKYIKILHPVESAVMFVLVFSSLLVMYYVISGIGKGASGPT